MPLRDDLLNPIPGANPAGENLRYKPVYDKIREARREDDDAPQGAWERARKLADWPLTIKLASDALATQSKDLQLTAWLTEALLRREGIPGLHAALELIQGLLSQFWESLYPELEDGDAEFRAAPLQWIGDRLEAAIKNVPLTRKGHDWFQYKQALAVGTEEDASQSDDKARLRQEAIADGKPTQEEFDSAFAATPKAFYADLLANFDSTLETVDALSQLCDEKFGDFSPSFSTLRRVLEEVRQTVYIFLQKKREIEPDEPAAAEPEAEVEGASEEIGEPIDTSAGAAAAPARAAIRKTGPLAAEPVDRTDAIGRVVSAARYLRKENPYDPAPYLMLRGLRWGELRAAGTAIDQTMLAAPLGEMRQNLKKLALESNWSEVLELAETAMGMDCGRGWLDLQRYVGRACYELGSYYEPIRSGVIAELRALLGDYPDLLTMTMMDDTATANAETQAWIEENVKPHAAAEPTSESAYASAMVVEETSSAPETGAPPDPFDLALQAARQGRAQEGMELLMREIAHAQSGRARFQRKAQLAQLCVNAGHEEIAYPILQELAVEVERRKLEDWEAAELLAHPLALLYRCMAAHGGAPEERQKLYAWICRLDPLRAMNVSR